LTYFQCWCSSTHGQFIYGTLGASGSHEIWWADWKQQDDQNLGLCLRLFMDHHWNQTTCGTLEELVAKSIDPVNKHAKRARGPSDLSKPWIFQSCRAPPPHPLSSGDPDRNHSLSLWLRTCGDLYLYGFVFLWLMLHWWSLNDWVRWVLLWMDCGCWWVVVRGFCWVVVVIEFWYQFLSNFDLSFVSFYWSVNPTTLSDHLNGQSMDWVFGNSTQSSRVINYPQTWPVRSMFTSNLWNSIRRGLEFTNGHC
jgi:hypothetical protein